MNANTANVASAEGGVRVDEPEVAHLDEQRDDDDLQRDHHRRQVQREQQVAAAERDAGEGVARRRGEHQLQCRRRDGDARAVGGEPPEREGVDDPPVVLAGQRVGNQRRRDAADVGVGLQ
jgi:hypothetical protein